jgi:hypothetical protein
LTLDEFYFYVVIEFYFFLSVSIEGSRASREGKQRDRGKSIAEGRREEYSSASRGEGSKAAHPEREGWSCSEKQCRG